MTQLHGMLVGLAALLASACASSDMPAAHGGDVSAAGGDPEMSLAAASGVVTSLTAAELPACTRAAGLDMGDPDSGACRSARTLVLCKHELDAELCLSDDPQRCPDSAPEAECSTGCAPEEYAVVCGGLAIHVPAPDGCHASPASPAGAIYSCCPCL